MITSRAPSGGQRPAQSYTAREARAAAEGVADEVPSGNYFVAAYPPFYRWSAAHLPAVKCALEAEDDSAPLGLYVHIPFCLARCEYCFYLSYANSPSAERSVYVDCLLAEWSAYARSARLHNRPLEFVYFGGGTPSLLGAGETERLLRGLQTITPWTHIREVTFECAPQSVEKDLIHVLRQAGVTRVSLGIQSWSDAILSASRRVHRSADAMRALEMIREAAFPILNVDLIAGLPHDEEASFLATVEQTVALRAESLTIYQLETPYYTTLSRGIRAGATMPVPDWPTKRRWLGEAFDRLEGAGYHVRSAYGAVLDLLRHAFIYQDLQYRGADLIGIGASAFSYCDGVHFQNKTAIGAYQMAVREGEQPIERAYALSCREQFVREFVLQMKLGGVDVKALSGKFAMPILAEWHSVFRRFADRGWLEFSAEEVRLTREGLLRADSMIRAFYLSEHQQSAYT